MPPKSPRFECPHCGTLYDLIEIETEGAAAEPIACLVCGNPLRATDGRFIFKYFLVGAGNATPGTRSRVAISLT
jgi:prepilin signal peptidase PulO-like enzyme (type II secretory pathway)